jgi:peptidyl-tRNA hydrolase
MTAVTPGDGDDPVMSLILRVERENPPTWQDALCAAGSAALQAWLRTRRQRLLPAATEAAWICRPKKVVRRARRGEWTVVSLLAIASARVGTAEVAVLPIGNVGDLPSRIRRLPVSGLELQGATEANDAQPSGPGIDIANGDLLEPPTIWITPEHAMSTGKAMAQVGHATIGLWSQLDERHQHAWISAGVPVEVRRASVGHWAELRADEDSTVTVKDAGLTEIAPGTVTVVGTWPHLANPPLRRHE